ncbi:MAG: hypothetical protein JSW50_08740 [Candidatus Latescibacterota bacterium]|nr:MAG: hypothetical protein JSW50_08740 [Candidatus Latescibacterota bacterium]
MKVGEINLIAGWVGILCGVVAGAGVGVFFHRESWAGGYASFERRMLRLAHISFFGLGFINLAFGATTRIGGIIISNSGIASVLFIVAAITMPLCCYLTAWRQSFRHLFPVPVICVAAGIIVTLSGWSSG